MNKTRLIGSAGALVLSLFANAGTYSFSTGTPDGLIGVGSRPGSPSHSEIEAADDFVLNGSTTIHSGSFTGLLVGGITAADIQSVGVEIYRVFPKDSDTGRIIHVPTRVNSPSDVAFASRDSGSATLSFGTTLLNQRFTVGNSVLNGINPSPNQLTGGEGAVTGQEYQFDFTFTTDMLLPGDHYFFVPQVSLSNGSFYWLSAPKPIVPPGTPFSPDLQVWIRDGNLNPDWLRVGTDITGMPPINGAFSLNGSTAVPGPAAVIPFLIGGVWTAVRRRKRA